MKFSHSQMLIVFAAYCLVQRIHALCKTEKPSQNSTLKLIEPLVGQSVKVTDNPQEYNYVISFCSQIGDATDAGVLQTDLKTGKKFVGGRINATSIQNGTDWIFLTYDDGDEYGSHCTDEKTRRSHIMLICNPDTLIGPAQVLEENNEKTKACYYMFEVQTSVACFSKTPHSSSVGWILVIIVLVVAAVYLVVGFLYQRFVAHAKGMEQIPNLSFWQKLGGLSADGCDFVCRCNRPEDVRSYKGLGDDQLGMDEEEDRDEHILPMY